MITKKELRSISLDFRRLSSNLLTTSYEQADVALARFYKYINETRWVYELLKPTVSESEYDFTECFMSNGDRREFQIPVDEKDHVKVQYDYMRYIVETENVNVFDLALKYRITEKKFDEMVREFLSDAFKPLIVFINDAISKELILLDEESKPTVTIGTNYGTTNIQGTGTITSETTVNLVPDEISQLIRKIMPSLEYINDIPDEEKENIRDDLESIQEQINSTEPKKSRMQKALSGIKNFVASFPMSLAVNTATTAIMNTDWTTLIQQIELFITTLRQGA